MRRVWKDPSRPVMPWTRTRCRRRRGSPSARRPVAGPEAAAGRPSSAAARLTQLVDVGRGAHVGAAPAAASSGAALGGGRALEAHERPARPAARRRRSRQRLRSIPRATSSPRVMPPKMLTASDAHAAPRRAARRRARPGGCGRAAADVAEVGGASAGGGELVERAHHEAGAVADHADVAVEGDVAEAGLAGAALALVGRRARAPRGPAAARGRCRRPSPCCRGRRRPRLAVTTSGFTSTRVASLLPVQAPQAAQHGAEPLRRSPPSRRRPRRPPRRRRRHGGGRHVARLVVAEAEQRVDRQREQRLGLASAPAPRRPRRPRRRDEQQRRAVLREQDEREVDSCGDGDALLDEHGLDGACPRMRQAGSRRRPRRTSARVSQTRTPPALPRPPRAHLRLDRDRQAELLGRRRRPRPAVRHGRPAGTGSPAAANSSLPWYSRRSTHVSLRRGARRSPSSHRQRSRRRQGLAASQRATAVALRRPRRRAHGTSASSHRARRPRRLQSAQVQSLNFAGTRARDGASTVSAAPSCRSAPTAERDDVGHDLGAQSGDRVCVGQCRRARTAAARLVDEAAVVDDEPAGPRAGGVLVEGRLRQAQRDVGRASTSG